VLRIMEAIPQTDLVRVTGFIIKKQL